MSQLFAERFKAARKMSGLSLQDLSDKLPNKISRQALHKYEKGEVYPDSQMIDFLATAFGVRPEYFSRDVKVELGVIEFRKLNNFPVKEKNKIVEKTRETVSRYLELEDIVGLQREFVNVLEGELITSNAMVEEAAIKLRKAWNLGLDPLLNVVEILEDNHIKVIDIAEEDGFDGLQTLVNGNIAVIVLNSSTLIQADRKRFTALHELAHLMLRFPDSVTAREKEMFCHYFAGAMLLPAPSAIKEVGGSRTNLYINELGGVKQQYGISIQALLHRLHNLGIITKSYTDQFLFYINQQGWKVDEPFKYEGKEVSKRFTQLLFRALAEDQITMSKAASLSNKKLADFRNDELFVQ